LEGTEITSVQEQTAQQISDAINHYGLHEKEVAKILTNQHPTLQQNFMNIATAFIVEMSKKTYADGRNRASVDKAKRIVSNMTYEDQEGQCPFI